jgi:hypothetical protein
VRTSDLIGCSGFPCADVRREGYVVPDVDVEPEEISIVLISEAAPPNPKDYYYAGADSLYQETTVQAFQDAGADVASMQDILKLGVYLTSAVKCAKTGYGIKAATIKECSLILENELALTPFADSAHYHVWAMEWDADSIRLYLGGVLMNDFDLSDATVGDYNPFRQKVYMHVNLAIGGECGGDPSGTTFPQQYYIDYIRVYERCGA